MLMLSKLSFITLLVPLGLLSQQATNIVATDALDSSGSHLYKITNTSTTHATVTGVTVMTERHIPGVGTVNSRWFYDSIMNPPQTPLKPGESYTFHLAPASANDSEPMKVFVESVIFSDGTTVGDQAAVQGLWDRRLRIVAAYREVFQHIDSQSAQSMDKTQLIPMLIQFRDEKLNSPTATNEDRKAFKVAYDNVIGNLQNPPNHESLGAILSSIRKREAARSDTMSKHVVPSGIRAVLGATTF